MTPSAEQLKIFHSLTAGLKSASDCVWIDTWKQAVELADRPDPLAHLTPEQRAEVDEAYRYWQGEESRDRGYDYAACRRLEREYRRLLARYTEEEMA